jgi:large subunit ribosomal protein L18e
MPHPTGPTDPNTTALIKKIRSKKEKFYLDLAKHLAKSARTKKPVNVSKIAKFSQDSIVVPGKVLGGGEITKPVTVYALQFSKEAHRKITSAGGKCLPLDSADKKSRILI